ncbi:MAG: aromatic ring-hydroxylating dioxygenase subunit alpha [Gammaproteobacteria bacterium]|nr:aromatic ring-hydroxylating dioxygenase subunit alpha [Gammaproteobacteria bacterium]
MATVGLAGELEWPAAGGSRAPYRVFTDPDIYEREQARIFRGPHWCFVGLEAELPESGDYKSTFVGDTPVVLTRDSQGAIHCWVNRCAHRGAQVCRELRGNSELFVCVYHQWSYDSAGSLVAVPFRRGIAGKGGMPKSFDLAEHGLQVVRVAIRSGLIFASFSDETESLETYLGETACRTIDRIFSKPLKILGDQRQYVASNWKIYSENIRDPYHASLLHLFHATFGLYRSSQVGGIEMDGKHRHALLHATSGSDDDSVGEYTAAELRTYKSEYSLQDPSLLKGRQEFDDGVTLIIQSLFPSVIVQQIQNTLAVRQILPKGVGHFELVWTHFGYEDDDAEMDAIRLKQSNLIGPAGLISMEDGEACEIVQKSIIRDADQASVIEMGGTTATDSDHLVTETSIIGFWEYYREAMDYPLAAP